MPSPEHATLREVAPDVLYATEAIAAFGPREIALVKERAAVSPRRRARVCLHPDDGDGLHQMLIALRRGVYIRPHRHPGKSESFHLIEGALRIAFFDEQGSMDRILTLAEPGQGDSFCYRMSESRFHTVLPLTEVVVFHEITNGPFRPEETLYADWAPAEADRAAGAAFVARLLAETA